MEKSENKDNSENMNTDLTPSAIASGVQSLTDAF